MLFTLILTVATVIAWAVARRSEGWKTHARRGMAGAMVTAGITHLVGADPFVQHLPTWVPAREAIVFVTGLMEIGLGVALVASRAHRALIGRLLAGFLLAVWPANIYVAVAGVDVEGQPGGAYPWIRLPFQVLFVAWALWSTHEPRGAMNVAAVPAASAVTSGRR